MNVLPRQQIMAFQNFTIKYYVAVFSVSKMTDQLLRILAEPSYKLVQQYIVHEDSAGTVMYQQVAMGVVSRQQVQHGGWGRLDEIEINMKSHVSFDVPAFH